MSYSFDGSNDTMTGAFTSTYAEPVTLAIWIKVTDHPLEQDTLIQLGNSSSSNNDSYVLRVDNTDNRWIANSISSGGATANAGEIINIDNTWTAIVGRFTSDSLREIFVGALANTDSNSTARAVADVLQFLSLGQSLNGSNDYTGLLAEAAIWDVALSDANITSYLAGTAASSIDAANLIGYWPLSASNATQSNLGVDAGGDLTVTSATFSSDHPTISSGSSTTVTPNAAGMGV